MQKHDQHRHDEAIDVKQNLVVVLVVYRMEEVLMLMLHIVLHSIEMMILIIIMLNE
jgi:hypothetical protein